MESNFVAIICILVRGLVTGLTISNSQTQHLRFLSPLTEDKYRSDVTSDRLELPLPHLLYLPGFDGSLISPFIQFPELSTSFNVWGLEVNADDRSSFEGLVAAIVNFVHECSTDVYLVGESNGGLLAAEAALQLEKIGQDSLRGLCLINPATSYLRSTFGVKAPTVANLPAFLYFTGLASLLPLFLDEHQFPQLLRIVNGAHLPSVIDSPAREAYMGRVAMTLGQRLPFMPQATLVWRLDEWLATGCRTVTDERLASLRTRCLVVCGDADLVLPSLDEATRLSELLPDCETFVVQGAGHCSICGSRCDLAAVLRNRFEELQRPGLRTAMKLEAFDGIGTWKFGMEKRKHPTVSPLDYWKT